MDSNNASPTTGNAEMITIKNIRTVTEDQLDDILRRTAYAEHGVAIGEGAAEDQDLRRAAQRELGRRMGFENDD